jgi:hypothetical protein
MNASLGFLESDLNQKPLVWTYSAWYEVFKTVSLIYFLSPKLWVVIFSILTFTHVLIHTFIHPYTHSREKSLQLMIWQKPKLVIVFFLKYFFQKHCIQQSVGLSSYRQDGFSLHLFQKRFYYLILLACYIASLGRQGRTVWVGNHPPNLPPATFSLELWSFICCCMQHGHAACTETCSMDSSCCRSYPCPCCTSMSMAHFHVHVHGACPSTCCGPMSRVPE